MHRKNLKFERKQKELTQCQVAKSIGISKQHYCRIEKGQQTGSVKIWDKLEEFFNTPQQKLREFNKSSNINSQSNNNINEETI